MNTAEPSIRIRCFADFTTSEVVAGKYERILSEKVRDFSDYGIHKKYSFTCGEDYTHVFIFNKAMPQINHIPKENVIGFAHEPIPFLGLTTEFVEYAKKHIRKYYLGDKMNLPEPFTEGNPFLFYNMPLSPSIPKTKFMSIMISQKIMAPGHQYRHQLVRHILNSRLPIDIYGRGCIYYNTNDSRIKGGFENNELYDGYQFTICIENYESNHYFSEKIINPLLSNITPFYLGCRNINSYFPNMLHHLSGDAAQDMELLRQAFSDPAKYIKQIDIENVVQTVDLVANLKKLL